MISANLMIKFCKINVITYCPFAILNAEDLYKLPLPPYRRSESVAAWSAAIIVFGFFPFENLVCRQYYEVCDIRKAFEQKLIFL